MDFIILSVLTYANGLSIYHAGLSFGGDIIQAQNDNQVANAYLYHSYLSNPESCTIHEDFSLSGDCAQFALDPDADSLGLDGITLNVPQNVSYLIDTW